MKRTALKIVSSKDFYQALIFSLYALLIFYLPFQTPEYRLLKPLSRKLFALPGLPSAAFDKIFYYTICDFFLIALIVISLLILKKERQKLTSFFLFKASSKYLYSFLLISFISIVFSQSSTHLWPYIRLAQFTLPPISLFLLAHTLPDPKKAIHLCFWIIALTSLLQGSIAIAQYIQQHAIGFHSLGESNIHFSYSPYLPNLNKQRWVFDQIFGVESPSWKILRPSGTLAHPNIFGGFIGMTLFASYFLLLSAKKRRQLIFFTAIIPFQIFILFLSFSRSALFAFLGASVFFFAFTFLHKRFKPLLKKFLLLLSTILVGGLFSYSTLKEQLAERGGVVSNTSHNIAADQDRRIYQNLSLIIFKESPALGCGWNHYPFEMIKHPEGQKTYCLQIVHNIYLLILAETGIFGLLSFLGFIASTLYASFKRGLDLTTLTLLAIFSFFLIIGLVDHYLITSPQGRLMFFLIAALLYTPYRKEDPFFNV